VGTSELVLEGESFSIRAPFLLVEYENEIAALPEEDVTELSESVS